MTPQEHTEYLYPSDRNKRPEDVEDVGMFPPTQQDRGSPLRGLARRKPSASTPPTPSPDSVADTQPQVEQPTTMSPDSESARRRDIHRGSTAMLPASLVAWVDQQRTDSSLSAGSIVVEAIERHLEELPRLLLDGSVTSAAGFRTRERIRDPHREQTTVFAYRLSGEDFATLDRLVSDLGARDRTHLIRTALTADIKGAP